MIINRLIFEGYISKLLSSFIYTIASIHIPLKARKRILKYLAKRLNITVEEAEYPIHKYKTINQLFTRGLKKDARPIDSNTLSIVSPVDGKIIGYGQLSKTTDTLPSPLKGHYFNIPSPPEKFLEYAYGKNWRTPLKNDHETEYSPLWIKRKLKEDPPKSFLIDTN